MRQVRQQVASPGEFGYGAVCPNRLGILSLGVFEAVSCEHRPHCSLFLWRVENLQQSLSRSARESRGSMQKAHQKNC